MRFVGKSRLGFYPLPLSEAQRIRRFLLFPDQSMSAVDPCVGDGVAFEVITNGAEVLRYGIELDAYRAEQAELRLGNEILAINHTKLDGLIFATVEQYAVQAQVPDRGPVD
ncbi:MAG: DUF6094 domain-containing protein [Terriglobia bacterium]